MPAPGGGDLLGPVLARAAERGHRRPPSPRCTRPRMPRRRSAARTPWPRGRRRPPPNAGAARRNCTRPATPDDAASASSALALRPVADDHVTDAGMALPQQRQRRDHVRVALSLDQVADGHQRRACRVGWRSAAGTSVPRWSDAGLPRAPLDAPLGGAGAVGEHQAGVAECRLDRAGAGVRAVDVAAVHGDDQRRYPAPRRLTASPAGTA